MSLNTTSLKGVVTQLQTCLVPPICVVWTCCYSASIVIVTPSVMAACSDPVDWIEISISTIYIPCGYLQVLFSSVSQHKSHAWFHSSCLGPTIISLQCTSASQSLVEWSWALWGSCKLTECSIQLNRRALRKNVSQTVLVVYYVMTPRSWKVRFLIVCVQIVHSSTVCCGYPERHVKI